MGVRISRLQRSRLRRGLHARAGWGFECDRIVARSADQVLDTRKARAGDGNGGIFADEEEEAAAEEEAKRAKRESFWLALVSLSLSLSSFSIRSRVKMVGGGSAVGRSARATSRVRDSARLAPTSCKFVPYSDRIGSDPSIYPDHPTRFFSYPVTKTHLVREQNRNKMSTSNCVVSYELLTSTTYTFFGSAHS